ncbi:squalene synthase HpnC [Alcaligenaceae bacterium]|nr:squalene synthase HpnC [Alcaligenaceae bacterium]
MAVDHYENFPVASLLLPRRLRAAVTDIYRYARSADDIADEGDAGPAQRLQALETYREALAQIGRGAARWPHDHPLSDVFGPLAGTIRRHALPLQPFYDLLSAFEQDVTVHRYENLPQLLDYCRRSANPVGRLMLHLYGRADTGNFECADAICTGLQLANFWQDVAIDWRKNRVYIPLDAFERHGLEPGYIGRSLEGVRPHTGPDPGSRGSDPIGSDPSHSGSDPVLGPTPGQDIPNAAWQSLMREQVGLARRMLRSGMPLTGRLPGRIGFELKLVVHGGLRILERLDQLHYDIFQHRPTLEKRDWMLLLWRALRPLS